MRSILTFILIAFSLAGFGQTYELKYDSVRLGKNGSSGVIIPGKLWLKGITEGLSTDSIVVTRNGKLFRYIKSSGVTSITPGTGFTSSTPITTTGTLNVNTGYSSGQIMTRISGGFSLNSGLDATIKTGSDNQMIFDVSPAFDATNGFYSFRTRNTERLRFHTNGDVTIENLKSGGTAPATSGTTKALISDADGLISFKPELSLTTTGSSGAATYNSSTGVLNIPEYTGGGGGSGTVNSGSANRLAYYGSSGTAVSNLSAITANRALVSDGDGLPTASSVTNTELGYVSGVTSAIQTQLNGKQASLSGTGFIKASGSTISYDNTSYLPLTGGTLSGAVTGTTFTASGGFFDTSDMRLKTRVNTSFNASKIKSFTYKFKDDNTGRLHVGYSAQQVRLYMPDAVNKDEKGNLSVNYTEILVQKVAELEAKLAKLEKEVKKLKKK